MDLLKAEEEPLTAEAIYLKLKESDTEISLSTVYRILDAFITKGLAAKTSLADENKTLYELHKEEHKHHLVCLNCKKIQAVYHCPLRDYEKDVEQETEFNITGHKLEMYGYCPDCQRIIDKLKY
jgi:Fur family ferric uptake transcriptional regulator